MPNRKTLKPVVYDMMLLAQALLDLREYVHVNRWEPLFPKRENAKTSAQRRIRTLARFWAGDLAKDRRVEPVKVTASDLNWTPDKRFYDRCWEPVSNPEGSGPVGEYAQRVRRLSARDIMKIGPRIMQKTRDEIDRRSRRDEGLLKGDTKRWYGRFKNLYQQLRGQLNAE